MRLNVSPSHTRSGIFGGIAAGFSTILALRYKRGQEEELFSEYRTEIAEALGKPEKEVSAKDWEYFKEKNPMLQQAAQALHFSFKDWGIMLLSAIGAGFMASEGASHLVKQRHEGSRKADGSKIAGGTFGILGGIFLGGQMRKLVYDHSIEGRLQNTAHGLLMEMKGKLLEGGTISPSHVMALQVAVNPNLIAPHILMRGNEAQEEQLRAEYPERMQQNAQLAKAINEGQLRPHQLIFALKSNGEWDMTQLPQPKKAPEAVASVDIPQAKWGAQERTRQGQKKEAAGMGV